MSSISMLRAPYERERFTTLRLGLSADVQGSVKKLMGRLRIEDPLPGPEDVVDVIPPCLPASRRLIPGTDLWLIYVVSDDNSAITFWTIRADSQLW